MAGNNKKIWLSHSGIDVLYRCPRCFWLRYNKKIYQPEGIRSRLPDRFDTIIKAYFDISREKGDLPEIVKGKMKGSLERPFQEKYFRPLNDSFGFWGKLDECLIDPKGLYIPVDFKTASSDPTERDVFPSYQNQLDEYAFLLESAGKKTAGKGYLIYFYPRQDDGLHNGFPMKIHVQELKTDPRAVIPRLEKAMRVIVGGMPSPAADCPFCKWYSQIKKVLE